MLKTHSQSFFTIVLLSLLSFNLTARGDSLSQGPRPLKGGDVRIGEMIDDLTFRDIDGMTGKLGDFQKDRFLVIAFTGTSCPLNLKYLPTLAEIEKQYLASGVRFIFVAPTPSDSVASMKEAIEHHQLLGRYIPDGEQKLATALGGDTTTEVFVLDAKRTLLYRGAVDDQYGLGYSRNAATTEYLRDALQALLAGKRPRIEATWAPGCDLGLPIQTRRTPITYHNRISRIIQRHCADCHREGGAGPFALDTFEDLEGHAAMVQRVVKQGLMPAWFAAGPKPQVEDHPMPTQLWANDRSLSESEKRDLLDWLQGDRPKGDPRHAPLSISYSQEWAIGVPDAVFEISRPVKVKATGQMPYVNLIVDPQITEDRWVQAVEIQPTAKAAVHHVLVYVIEPGNQNRIDQTAGFLAAYVPGNTHQIFAPDHAKRIAAGSKFAFQLHYTPIGRELVDQTRLGLRFSDQDPTMQVMNHGIANGRISIPKGHSNHAEFATWTSPADVEITGFMPHMHLRGKAFRFELTQPDGQTKTLLDVPRYDFNWQLEYRLAEPLRIYQGTQIKVTGWFDNSAENPANPDPNRVVRWGPQTSDEMLVGYVEFVIPRVNVEEGSNEKSDPSAKSSRAAEKVKQKFSEVDTDEDGKVTPDELNNAPLFQRLDTDGDGVITLEEAMLGLAQNSGD